MVLISRIDKFLRFKPHNLPIPHYHHLAIPLPLKFQHSRIGDFQTSDNFFLPLKLLL